MNVFTIICIVITGLCGLYSVGAMIYGLIKRHQLKKRAKAEVLNGNEEIK